MATNYERGRAFEYRARDALKKAGAVFVMRAAGSHTKADLIALWPSPCEWADVWLVQCKRDGKLPAAEQQELLDIAAATGAEAYLAQAGAKGRGVVFQRLTKET